MTLEEIEIQIKDFENPIYFIGMLPQFIWDYQSKKVVDYSSSPDKNNDLEVIDTELINLSKPLKNYLDELELQKDDSLVFCINEQYLPKTKGNWIRLKIMKTTKIKR